MQEKLNSSVTSQLSSSGFHRTLTEAECGFLPSFSFFRFVLLPLLHFESQAGANVLLLPAMTGGCGSSSGRWLIAPRDGKCTVYTDDMGQLLSGQHSPPSKDPVFVFFVLLFVSIVVQCFSWISCSAVSIQVGKCLEWTFCVIKSSLKNSLSFTTKRSKLKRHEYLLLREATAGSVWV